MLKNMNKKTIYLAAVAAFLAVGLSVGSAMAYFTTYAVAQGGYTIELGEIETELEEKVDLIDPKKEIKLKNTGDMDCFVRLKVLVGDAFKEDMKFTEPGEEGKWTPGADGYYYYSDILKAEEMTTQLNVSFVFPEEEVTQFNVIVIQECTPVLYGEGGAPYADWNNKADVSQTIYP